MPSKKENKDLTWEDIGKAIGQKIEKFKPDECKSWKRHFTFHHKDHGGGFGRLVFGAGVVYAMHLAGMLNGIPAWLLVVIVLGFAMMRF